jgi:hypothetical protein
VRQIELQVAARGGQRRLAVCALHKGHSVGRHGKVAAQYLAKPGVAGDEARTIERPLQPRGALDLVG